MVKKNAGRFRAGPAGHQKNSRQSLKETIQFFWSIHPVLEALENSPASVQAVILKKGSIGKLENIIELAEKRNIPVLHDEDLFTRDGGLGEHHQGVAARITFPYVDLARFLAGLNDNEVTPFILALDSIQDPRNLGAIIRSAVAAGCSKLILPRDRSAKITGVVAQTSAGAVFHADVCQVTNLAVTLDTLKEAGIWVFGTSADSSLEIYQADFRVPVCLVIGNEEKGIRPLVKKHCDQLVAIPMVGKLDSLNASVAAGVVLFEIARQRTR